MFKSLSKKEIYDNSNLSFVFEFFTPLSKRDASARFARALGKKIKWFDKVDSDFTPTYETFKISPTYSNGYKEISLTTGDMPYQEAVHMLLKTLNVIESLGHTSSRCSLKTRIGLNEDALGLTVTLDRLNRLKYLLGINEEALFKMWPAQPNEHCKIPQTSPNFIQPRDLYNTVITENLVERMDPIEFKFPESDFFANDFSELGKGRLVVNYIGGKDYSKKKRESVDTINLVIEHLYETLASNYRYSPEEKKRISGIVNEFKNSIDGTRNYFNFKMLYPNVSVYIDLKEDTRMIESNYSIFREKLFKVIVGGGITEAVVNYDTRRKSLQIKDAVIKKNVIVEGVEFYQCDIEADAKGCLFEGCKILNSKVVECTIYSNNFIKNSKVIECDYLGGANEIYSSWVDNSAQKAINADLKECLVNRGKFTLNSSIDKSTTILKKLK